MIADSIVPKLSIIFRGLIRRGSFPECWRSAKVTAIPNGAPSPDGENYRPMSLTHILSKVYEKLVSHKSKPPTNDLTKSSVECIDCISSPQICVPCKTQDCTVDIVPVGTMLQKDNTSVTTQTVLSHKFYTFCKKYVFFPAPHEFAYRKFLGSTDALLTISHHLQSVDKMMESYIVQFYFSAAFDRVSHSGLLFKLKSIDVGGSVLSICRELFSNLNQRVVVDGATSEWIPIVPGVPQGSVLGPLLFILYTSEMFQLVILMTPRYKQLFASQQTDLLLQPPLTGTWLGFRSGAITGA